jgi:hypothetical protein
MLHHKARSNIFRLWLFLFLLSLFRCLCSACLAGVGATTDLASVSFLGGLDFRGDRFIFILISIGILNTSVGGSGRNSTSSLQLVPGLIKGATSVLAMGDVDLASNDVPINLESCWFLNATGCWGVGRELYLHVELHQVVQ